MSIAIIYCDSDQIVTSSGPHTHTLALQHSPVHRIVSEGQHSTAVDHKRKRGDSTDMSLAVQLRSSLMVLMGSVHRLWSHCLVSKDKICLNPGNGDHSLV